MHFIDIYEAMRRELGYTAAEMARLCDVASNLTTAWRRRPETEPQPKVLRRIAEGVNIEWLRAPGTGKISGWRKKPGAGKASEPGGEYGNGEEHNKTGGVVELYMGPLLELVRSAGEMSQPSLDAGETMREADAETYEHFHRMLMLDLEDIASKALFEMQRRMREFEREISRHDYETSKEEKGQ